MTKEIHPPHRVAPTHRLRLPKPGKLPATRTSHRRRPRATPPQVKSRSPRHRPCREDAFSVCTSVFLGSPQCRHGSSIALASRFRRVGLIRGLNGESDSSLGECPIWRSPLPWAVTASPTSPCSGPVRAYGTVADSGERLGAQLVARLQLVEETRGGQLGRGDARRAVEYHDRDVVVVGLSARTP